MLETKALEGRGDDVAIALVTLANAGDVHAGQASEDGEYWLLSNGRIELSTGDSASVFEAPHVFRAEPKTALRLTARAPQTVIARLQVQNERR